MPDWSIWLSFPSREKLKDITAPKGPGVYQLKNKITDEYILFGIGIECQKRMRSLMPAPFGVGTRNNGDKRDYVLKNYKDIIYRTMSVTTRKEAALIEKQIKNEFDHKYNT